MLLKSTLAKTAYRLFALIMTVFYSINGAYMPPSTEQSMTAKKEDARLVFLALADPQISNYMLKRYPVFEAVSDDLHNNEGNFQALLIAGDIAENGFDCEYQLVYDKISGIEGCRYLSATGNHDIRLRYYGRTVKHFTSFANALNGDEAMTALNYSETINGYKFIVMGSDKTMFEEAYLSDAQLEWLDKEIESANGVPTFVVIHQPFKDTHGLPDAWNSPLPDAGSVGKQNDKLIETLSGHKNVIVISGHLHAGFGEKSHEVISDFNSVNIPGTCVNNADGDYNETGVGFVVEVYDNEVIFRARNLAKGIWLPEYDITIPVTE